MLIISGGLPDTGKTTIARELACQVGVMHLRIDSIEQAIRDCSPDAVGIDEAGYRVASVVALRHGDTSSRVKSCFSTRRNRKNVSDVVVRNLEISPRWFARCVDASSRFLYDELVGAVSSVG